MKYNNSIFLIFITLVLSGCIGPLYNPYPLSKLSAKVGPPLKLDTMSVEEQINAEIQAESNLEANQEEILSTDNTSQSVDQQNTGEETQNKLDIEVVKKKPIVIKWTIVLKKNYHHNHWQYRNHHSDPLIFCTFYPGIYLKEEF